MKKKKLLNKKLKEAENLDNKNGKKKNKPPPLKGRTLNNK